MPGWPCRLNEVSVGAIDGREVSKAETLCEDDDCGAAGGGRRSAFDPRRTVGGRKAKPSATAHISHTPLLVGPEIKATAGASDWHLGQALPPDIPVTFNTADVGIQESACAGDAVSWFDWARKTKSGREGEIYHPPFVRDGSQPFVSSKRVRAGISHLGRLFKHKTVAECSHVICLISG